MIFLKNLDKRISKGILIMKLEAGYFSKNTVFKGDFYKNLIRCTMPPAKALKIDLRCSKAHILKAICYWRYFPLKAGPLERGLNVCLFDKPVSTDTIITPLPMILFSREDK